MSFSDNPAAGAPASTKPAPRVRILVADDEPGICRLVARTLERAGYDVACVPDGSRILPHLERHPVDLLITDLVMPETEGIETIIQLRKTHPELPVIAMSGGDPRGTADFLSIAQILGAKATLRKPFDCETLLATVREQLPGPA